MLPYSLYAHVQSETRCLPFTGLAQVHFAVALMTHHRGTTQRLEARLGPSRESNSLLTGWMQPTPAVSVYRVGGTVGEGSLRGIADVQPAKRTPVKVICSVGTGS